jgi:hypothetical protein
VKNSKRADQRLQWSAQKKKHLTEGGVHPSLPLPLPPATPAVCGLASAMHGDPPAVAPTTQRAWGRKGKAESQIENRNKAQKPQRRLADGAPLLPLALAPCSCPGS